MLIIGCGKVCNSKLTLSNFAKILNYTAALNTPLRIQYLRQGPKLRFPGRQCD